MTTRGNGRVFQRNGSSFWWVAYYVHGKEVREVGKHVRTGNKLATTEDNRQQAEPFLKHRMGEVITERHGGPSFHRTITATHHGLGIAGCTQV